MGRLHTIRVGDYGVVVDVDSGAIDLTFLWGEVGQHTNMGGYVMSMSKQDFIALADAIREHNRCEGEPFDEHQLETLATFCRRQNHAFKYERWMDYIKGECGPNGGAVKLAPKPKNSRVEYSSMGIMYCHDCGRVGEHEVNCYQLTQARG